MADSRNPRYGRVDTDYGRHLATADPDGPVWMVNLMHYRDRADYPDGTDHGRTGREADDEYAPVDVLADIGAEPVLLADVEDQLLGDAPRWDRVGIVRYPTRRAFIEMQLRPDFQERHVHKDAGMASTIVMGCLPVTPPVPEAPADWSAVPHPPSADDGKILVLHVIRYQDDEGARRQLADYGMAAWEVARAHGARPEAWFTVEGTIVGDGRSWDEVRFNAFPSRRALEAVVTDPDRLRAQAERREPAIADTYTLVLRPTIDRLADSVRPA